MRIRSIKPEFWRSDDIAALPISARLLFIGLWSYVDDNGVGSDKVSSIAADLFAADLEADPTETFRRVSADTACLTDRGLIIRYRASGKPLMYVTNWERHQLVKNPSKGRLYPLPPAELLEPFALLPSVYVDPTESPGTGAGEQGNRGTEDQGSGGGADAPRSLYCSDHQPNGTKDKCGPCRSARLAFEAAQKSEKHKPTAVPEPYSPEQKLCTKHHWMPDGTCMKCTAKRDAA